MLLKLSIMWMAEMGMNSHGHASGERRATKFYSYCFQIFSVVPGMFLYAHPNILYLMLAIQASSVEQILVERKVSKGHFFAQ